MKKLIFVLLAVLLTAIGYSQSNTFCNNKNNHKQSIPCVEVSITDTDVFVKSTRFSFSDKIVKVDNKVKPKSILTASFRMRIFYSTNGTISCIHIYQAVGDDMFLCN